MLIPCSARSNTDNKMPWILTEGSFSRSSESWPLPPGIEVQRCKEQTNSTVYSCLFKFKSRVLLKCDSYTSLTLLLYAAMVFWPVQCIKARIEREERERAEKEEKEVATIAESEWSCDLHQIATAALEFIRSNPTIYQDLQNIPNLSCLTGTRLYSGAKRRSSCQRSQCWRSMVPS